MFTINDYLDQLDIDKDTLYDALNDAGVEVSSDETFTTLTPKVDVLVDASNDLLDNINGEEI